MGSEPKTPSGDECILVDVAELNAALRDIAALRATIEKAKGLARAWERDHAPPGDAVCTPAELALDSIGEVLGLWGEAGVLP